MFKWENNISFCTIADALFISTLGLAKQKTEPVTVRLFFFNCDLYSQRFPIRRSGPWCLSRLPVCNGLMKGCRMLSSPTPAQLQLHPQTPPLLFVSLYWVANIDAKLIQLFLLRHDCAQHVLDSSDPSRCEQKKRWWERTTPLIPLADTLSVKSITGPAGARHCQSAMAYLVSACAVGMM